MKKLLFATLALFLFGLTYGQVLLTPPSYSLYQVGSVERDADKIACGSQWSDTMLFVYLKKVSDNTGGWYWTSTNKPGVKEIVSISMTALATGMNVQAAVDLADYRSCASTGRLISLLVTSAP